MKWISVKDRLPEKGYVFCCNNWSLPFVGNYNTWDDKLWRSGGEIINVTHWMPLPESPEN